jgi:hypothetical protein
MKTSILKTSLFSLVLMFAVSVASAKGGKLKYDSLSCLLIEGRVLDLEEKPGDCVVELIDANNEVVDSLILRDGKSKFGFVLQKNTYYAIRISKEGYISKLVSINTEILTEQEGIHRFNFQTRLMNNVLSKRLNQDVIDFPVAIIHFDYENNCFDYDKEYTTKIKKELFTTTSTKRSEQVTRHEYTASVASN